MLNERALAITSGATGSTPPPPPPKPSSHPRSSSATPRVGSVAPSDGSLYGSQDVSQQPGLYIPAPSFEEDWLIEFLKDRSYCQTLECDDFVLIAHSKRDLELVHQTPELLSALLHAPDSAHPALLASTAPIVVLLAQNISIASRVLTQSKNLTQQRTEITAKSLSLRALERQWHLKQTAMDDALSEFSPKAVHARLVSGIQEQEALLHVMEESFFDNEGIAGERETTEFLKRWREARKVLDLRQERRARFDAGRVGGWR